MSAASRRGAMTRLLVPVLALAGCAPLTEEEQRFLEAFEGSETWEQADGMEGLIDGPGGREDWIEIRWNDLALDALPELPEPLPAGSAVLKRNYADAEASELVATVLMLKDDEGWTYGRLFPDGELSPFGQPESCLGCHAGGEDELLGVE